MSYELRDRLRDIISMVFEGGDLTEITDATIALVRAETLEEAAKLAEGFPTKTHGNLATAPYAAAEQAAEEIAAAIRALKEKPNA